MEKGHQKSIWIFSLTIFLSILYSSISYAKTYKWDDFTEPFKNKFDLHEGQNVTIEINLPDFIIRNYKIVPLYIDYSFSHSASNYPNVRVNKSIWAVYYLTNSKVLNIKTKYLQSGLNKLKFYLERDVSERSTSVDASIKELRFDLAEIDSLRAKSSKKNGSEKKPAKSASNKKTDNQLKKSDYKKLKAYNRSLDKGTGKYLQHALKHLGYYDDRVDGVLGRKTRRAVKAYQKNEGKAATGYLDKESVKKLVQIARVASKNSKKKSVVKAEITKKPVRIEKKKSADNQVQNKTNDQLQPKKIHTAVILQENKPEIENGTKIENQINKKAEIDKLRNDGFIKTPEELEARYKSLIDTFNQAMNETFYNQMITSLESCNRTGYYISGAFISHYLYMRFNDLASMAQERSDFQRKAKLAEHFENTRNQMIRYYNASAGNKQALKAVLNKCDEYYKITDTKSLLSKK